MQVLKPVSLMEGIKQRGWKVFVVTYEPPKCLGAVLSVYVLKWEFKLELEREQDIALAKEQSHCLFSNSFEFY